MEQRRIGGRDELCMYKSFKKFDPAGATTARGALL